MTNSYDAIIIGGGIVGASAAYYLAKSGKQVALLEKGLRGSFARTQPLSIDMRKLVVWGAAAYRQRLDGRVNIAVSEDGFHDIMLDSLLHGYKYLPLAREVFNKDQLEGSRVRVGVWEAKPYKEKLVNYPCNEFMYVIEGSCTIIEEDGNTEKFTQGECFFIPNGFNGYREQGEPMKKYYMIVEAS